VDREKEMNQGFLLSQKVVTILVTAFGVLLLLVFLAGYLSGTLVGLPEPEEPPPIAEPTVKPLPKPPVATMPVPQPDDEPEVEAPVEAVEPEPEPEPAPVLIAAEPAEKLYSVQVGAFRTRERAEARQQQLVAKGYQPYIYHGANSKGRMWYTLRLRDFDDVDEAVVKARDFMALEGYPAVLTHFDSLMMVRDENGQRIEIAPVGDTASEKPEPVAEEPDLIAEEAESVAEEPKLLAEEPEAAAEEPEAAAEEPEAAVEEPEAAVEETDPVADGAAVSEDRSVGGLIASAEADQYAVQVGAFLNGDNAVKFAEKLRGRGYPAYVFQYTDTAGNNWSAVRAGDFKDREAARAAANDFEEKEKIIAIVTKIDAIKMVF